MARRARDDRYGHVAIAFHWVIAVLVLVNLWIGICHESLPRTWQLMPLHRSIGITVLALTLARIGWRLFHQPPRLPGHVPAWERGAAHATHWLLYALMLILPLSGWVMGSNPDRLRPFSWFGLIAMPPLPTTPALARAAHEAHELLGWLMAALVVVHVLAALRHHFLLRDNVLRRMLPLPMRRPG